MYKVDLRVGCVAVRSGPCGEGVLTCPPDELPEDVLRVWYGHTRFDDRWHVEEKQVKAAQRLCDDLNEPLLEANRRIKQLEDSVRAVHLIAAAHMDSDPSPTQAPETGDPSTPPTQGRGEGSPAPASTLKPAGRAGSSAARIPDASVGAGAAGAPGFAEAIIARLGEAKALRSITDLGQSGGFSFELSREPHWQGDGVFVRTACAGNFVFNLDFDCLCALLRTVVGWAFSRDLSPEAKRRILKAVSEQGPDSASSYQKSKANLLADMEKPVDRFIDIDAAMKWLAGLDLNFTFAHRDGVSFQMREHFILEYLRRGWKKPKAVLLNDLRALLEVLSMAPVPDLDEPRTSSGPDRCECGHHRFAHVMEAAQWDPLLALRAEKRCMAGNCDCKSFKESEAAS